MEGKGKEVDFFQWFQVFLGLGIIYKLDTQKSATLHLGPFLMGLVLITPGRGTSDTVVGLCQKISHTCSVVS